MSKLEINGINLVYVQNQIIKMELNDLLKYQENMEAHISKSKKETEGRFGELNQVTNKITNEEFYHLEEILVDDYQNYSKHYPNRLRSSMFLQTYSLMEHSLKKICDFICMEKELTFRVHDLKGNGDLEKVKKYLTRTCEANINNLNPEWKYIQDIRELRNKIVHENGTIEIDIDFPEKGKKLRTFIKTHEYLTVISGEENFAKEKGGYYEVFITSDQFNSEFIETLKSFFTKLVAEVYGRKDLNT